MSSSPLRNSSTPPTSYTVTAPAQSYGTSTSYTSNLNPTSLGLSYTFGTDAQTSSGTAPQGYTITTTTHHHTSSGTSAPQGFLTQDKPASYTTGNLSSSYNSATPKKTDGASYLSTNYNYNSSSTTAPTTQKVTQSPSTQTTAQTTIPARNVQSQPQSVAQISSRKPSQDVSKTNTRAQAHNPVGEGPNPEAAFQSLENRSVAGLRHFQDFINLRTEMGFHLINAKDAVLSIRDRIGHITHLTLDEFIMVFTELFRGKFSNFYEFIDKLALIFQFVDTNSNGYLEIGETLQAFVHLFGGDEEDKIRAAFYLFDLDNSGFLDHNEVYTMIYNTIRLHENTTAELSDEEEQKIAQIAKATSHDLFNTLDLDGDEKVSLDEFLVWYKGFNTGVKPEDIESAKKMREAKIHDLLNKGIVIDPHHDESHDLVKAFDELNEKNAFMHLVDEVRKKVPLDKIHIHLAVDLLQALYPNMTVNFPQFVNYLETLVKQNGLPGVENVREIARRLFNSLDDNKNGLLDVSEIVTGLSLLCGGSMYDKLRTSFDLFDANGDKVLDFNEASRMMHAFFKFMQVDTPYLKLANGNANEWAVALTHKLFEEVEIPKDQGIPISVFEGWASSVSKVQ